MPFGFKLWCLCIRLGYIVQSEPNQDASTDDTTPNLGVGGSIVCNLIRELLNDNTHSI